MQLHEFTDWLTASAHSLFAALGPAALGSAVAQSWKTGLSWSQRLVQLLVGIVSSYYVTRGVAAYLELDGFAVSSIGFVVGMIAYETAPKFTNAASDAIAGLPALLAAWIGRGKGESK